MLRHFSIAIALITIGSLTNPLFAQDQPNASIDSETNTPQEGRADLPGTLRLELGFNFLRNNPEAVKSKFWGSKTANLYYLYDIQILKSKWAFSPGIGISNERIRFNRAFYFQDEGDKVSIQNFTTNFGIETNLRNNKFTMTTVEVPLEIQFHGNKTDHRQGLLVAVGVKFGYILASKTKLKYRIDGQNIVDKLKNDFELNRLRYNLNFRIGWSAFQFYTQYNITPLFKKDKLQDETGEIWNSDINILTFGLSFRIF